MPRRHHDRRRARLALARSRPPASGSIGRRAAVGGRVRRHRGPPCDRRGRPPVDLSVELAPGLRLANPILVASGTFGYGIEYGDVVDVERLGAICCKGTTLKPRIGNVTPRVTETPAGMLNSIGLQNPGVDAVIERYAPTWAGWRVPVIVNVAGESIDDYVEVARRLDGVPGVAGIELNISCPNVGKGGLQFAIDAEAAGAVTAAVRRATDLPLLVKLSPNVADVRPIARAIEKAGADAITAINTLSGIAVRPDRTPAAPRERLRRAVRSGDQAGRAADRLRGRPRSSTSRSSRSAACPSWPTSLDFLAVGAVAVQVGTAAVRRPDAAGPDRRRPRRRVPPARPRQLPPAHRDRPAAEARRAVREGRRVPAVRPHR